MDMSWVRTPIAPSCALEKGTLIPHSTPQEAVAGWDILKTTVQTNKQNFLLMISGLTFIATLSDRVSISYVTEHN